MDINKSFGIKWFGIQFGIFAVYFVIACAVYHSYLTNEYTPGGDGPRIYPYLKYMEKVPERFPLWQAHKHHGYPLMADPENHMPLSLILDTESPYFNIHLNLVFFSITAIFAFICRSLARMLGLGRIASLCVGLTTIFGCIFTIRGFFHGAFNALLYHVLFYLSLGVLFFVMTWKKYLYLIIFIPVLLSWTVQCGYYLPFLYHIPAFILLMCMYIQFGRSLLDATKRTLIVLALITISMFCLSMPFLLPLLDGIYLSRTFAMDIQPIGIFDQDIYNYYFGLWPFILLALLYARGMVQRYATLFLAMAGINFILILLNAAGFNTFFDLWSNVPVVKNIRHQLVFSNLSSIAAAFCAGIFIDSCKDRVRTDKSRGLHALMFGCILLFLLIAYQQWVRQISFFMVMVTIIFIFMTLFRNRFYIVLGLFAAMAGLLAYNLKESPLHDGFLTSLNNSRFSDYDGPYYWGGDFSGRDKFTPYFHIGPFSMVFLHEYRLLLSLLYNQEIKVQRPHWIGVFDNVKRNKQNLRIARLMGIGSPNRRDWESPFRVYDRWIVVDETEAIELMKQDNFTADGPIILAQDPAVSYDTKTPLQAAAVLTGKTAETIALQVNTNKNSILLIPEIYHRNWYAQVNGKDAAVIKAYASMRAVALPPGQHEIRMKFVYKPFWWGLYIALGFLAVMIGLVHVFRDKLGSLLWPDMDASARISRCHKNC